MKSHNRAEKQTYRSKASVLLYVDELHVPFLLLNWVYVDVAIEHGWRDLTTELPANAREYSRLSHQLIAVSYRLP